VARSGDTVANVATRVGLPAAELARHNGLPVNAPLNAGEVLALPSSVPRTQTAALSPGAVDIQTLAGDAIERAGTPAAASAPAASVGPEPTRHKVEQGETAYSIARIYGVSPKSVAEWNGLGPDLEVRVGQVLLIPVVVGTTAPVETATSTTAPGSGSPTPMPPSAAKPLPDEKTQPSGQTTAASTPESPNLAQNRTAASSARMTAPVDGSIIRDFQKGKNDGIDISAASGAPVKAAAGGTVAAITEDTDQVPILVIRHDDGLLTVYANVDNLKVKKGQNVSRGQPIATVRAAGSPYLHFEVRKGVEAVDPTDYLN
jgi:murein DD-endopeptidase MepM/ murein hydrolase activator NlpD